MLASGDGVLTISQGITFSLLDDSEKKKVLAGTKWKFPSLAPLCTQRGDAPPTSKPVLFPVPTPFPPAGLCPAGVQDGRKLG